MSAGNYIGYFAHMIDTGKMTEEEANRRLREMFEADMRADEFDREFAKKSLRVNNMKRQYRYLESYGFKYIIQLYHDGELVKSHTVYLDKLQDAVDAFEADGYTYGYTEREVDKAKGRYEEMLRNKI